MTEYEVAGRGDGGAIRVAQLSDLHSACFGVANSRLISKVEEQKPDIICFTGDTVSSDEEDFSVAADLVRELVKVAPVYISLGNHETDLSDKLLDKFIDDMTDAGATVLEKEYIDTEINGNKVRIGGTSGNGLSVPFWEKCYYKKASEYFDDEAFSEQRFLLDFEDTESYKILLLHRPEAATLFWADDGWYKVDLVLSGHTHGGQVRLPFIGGLYAPEEGYFPDYEYGYFRKNDCDIIVSAGLGSGHGMPRINNIPEIVTVDIVK